VVHAGVDRDEVRRMEIADQVHRLAGSSQADFHFRTYRDPLDKPAERVDQKTIPLVAAVVADRLAK
jgi:hypothetical protein